MSDRVAMGLLLRIKSVQREVATKSLKTFLEGSDEDRLKILADTFNLNKRRLILRHFCQSCVNYMVMVGHSVVEHWISNPSV